MFKLLKLLKKNSRGEVAAALTLISFALMVAGTLLGSYIAQRETKTISKAAGYNWNNCLQEACNPSFDGTTVDNDWCQGNKIRCSRKNGKVCQLPDPWCNSPDQGHASTCTGVHTIGSDTGQTCTSAGKNNGDNICEPPNENWETNPACPYVPYVPPGGAPPPGASGTQCSDEGGTCQRVGICGTIPNHYLDPSYQPKGCLGPYPECCKEYITPTPTPVANTISGNVTVNFANKNNFKEVRVEIANTKEIDNILDQRSFYNDNFGDAADLLYQFDLPAPADKYIVMISVFDNRGRLIQNGIVSTVNSCSGTPNTANPVIPRCDNMPSGGKANFTINISGGAPPPAANTISGNITVNYANQSDFDRVRITLSVTDTSPPDVKGYTYLSSDFFPPSNKTHSFEPFSITDLSKRYTVQAQLYKSGNPVTTNVTPSCTRGNVYNQACVSLEPGGTANFTINITGGAPPPVANTISGNVKVNYTDLNAFDAVYVSAVNQTNSQDSKGVNISNTAFTSSGSVANFALPSLTTNALYKVSASVYKSGNLVTNDVSISVLCTGGNTDSTNPDCVNMQPGGTANFTITISGTAPPPASSVPFGTIKFQVNITVGDQEYDNIRVYACPNIQCTQNDGKWVLNTGPNPSRLVGGSHSKDFDGLTDDTPYRVFAHVYFNNKVVYSSVFQTVTPPAIAQFNISLPKKQGREGNIPLSYTAANYKKVIDGFLQGTYSALQISEWVSKATYTPGIKIQTCDPMKGECDMPT